MLGLFWRFAPYLAIAVAALVWHYRAVDEAERRGYAQRDYLVTHRLIHYSRHGCGWRRDLAVWICTHLLDLFDPKGDHC